MDADEESTSAHVPTLVASPPPPSFATHATLRRSHRRCQMHPSAMPRQVLRLLAMYAFFPDALGLVALYAKHQEDASSVYTSFVPPRSTGYGSAMIVGMSSSRSRPLAMCATSQCTSIRRRLTPTSPLAPMCMDADISYIATLAASLPLQDLMAGFAFLASTVRVLIDQSQMPPREHATPKAIPDLLATIFCSCDETVQQAGSSMLGGKESLPCFNDEPECLSRALRCLPSRCDEMPASRHPLTALLTHFFLPLMSALALPST